MRASWRELPNPQRVTAFRRLERGRAGAILSKLDAQTLNELVSALGEAEVSLILDRMPADHAAEVVDELPGRAGPRKS